jgi:hypothetical protein
MDNPSIRLGLGVSQLELASELHVPLKSFRVSESRLVVVVSSCHYKYGSRSKPFNMKLSSRDLQVANNCVAAVQALLAHGASTIIAAKVSLIPEHRHYYVVSACQWSGSLRLRIFSACPRGFEGWYNKLVVVGLLCFAFILVAFQSVTHTESCLQLPLKWLGGPGPAA